jgi:hypothetical protein
VAVAGADFTVTVIFPVAVTYYFPIGLAKGIPNVLMLSFIQKITRGFDKDN